MPTTAISNPVAQTKSAHMTVKLDTEDRMRLKSLAVSKNRATHYLMKEAIQRYIVEEEAEQVAIQEAAASLEHYKKTGLHVTLDEVRAWAQAVKLDRNAKMPICHT